MTVKERLKIYLKHKNINASEFGRTVGVSNAYISSMVKSIPPDKLQRITLNYPDLNTEWLLTGESEMLKTVPSVSTKLIKGQDYRFVPVYNFDAVGGMHTGNDITDTPAYVERHVPFIGAHPDDICVHVTGNSMIPTYSPGSLLLIRKVQDWMQYFGYGHTYVIFLRDGRRILKEVQRYSENPQEYVLCISHNKDYPEEELPKGMIVDVYKVIITLTNEGF